MSDEVSTWIEVEDEAAILMIQAGPITTSLRLTARQALQLGSELVDSARTIEG